MICFRPEAGIQTGSTAPHSIACETELARIGRFSAML
jgi:hypothetical protein